MWGASNLRLQLYTWAKNKMKEVEVKQKKIKEIRSKIKNEIN